MEHTGARAVASGDYKRRADPTTRPFELERCHLFITEATFGLPVFRHEPDTREIGRLLASVHANTERTHLIGAYGLGKAQRPIALLRRLQPADLVTRSHAVNVRALRAPGRRFGRAATRQQCRWRRDCAVPAVRPDGSLEPAADRPAHGLRLGLDAGARARQHGVELPLVVSDHADWAELVGTIAETEAEEVWVTHGREDALVHQIGLMGKCGRALALVGFEEEGE